ARHRPPRGVPPRATRPILPPAVPPAAAAVTAGSAAARSCGVAVIDDWYGSKNGRLSKVYPRHCYADAIKIIEDRPDIDIYTNAKQDILLALQQAIAAGKGGKGPGGGAPPSDPATADALPSFLGGPNAKAGGQSSEQPITIKTSARPRKPVDSVLGTDSASSVPLPAIVLGSVAALLLALGSAAFIARRRQQRRHQLRPQAQSGPPNS